MTPAKDEVASFQRRRKSAPNPAAQSRGNTLTYTVAICLSVVLAGGSYWGYTAVSGLQLQLSSTQSQLDQALANLDTVNEQLELTDQVLNQPGGSVQKKLALFDSEIRKLWGNYKKQRSLMSSNEKGLATAKANHKNVSKKITSVSSQSKKADKSQSKKVAAVSKSITSTKAQIKTTSNQLNAQISKLRSEINKLPRQQKSTNLTPLSRKIQSNEEAIVAIDSFRVQTNRTLDKLRKTIIDMQTKLDVLSSSSANTP